MKTTKISYQSYTFGANAIGFVYPLPLEDSGTFVIEDILNAIASESERARLLRLRINLNVIKQIAGGANLVGYHEWLVLTRSTEPLSAAAILTAASQVSSLEETLDNCYGDEYQFEVLAGPGTLKYQDYASGLANIATTLKGSYTVSPKLWSQGKFQSDEDKDEPEGRGQVVYVVVGNANTALFAQNDTCEFSVVADWSYTLLQRKQSLRSV